MIMQADRSSQSKSKAFPLVWAYTEENVTGTAKPKVGVFTCTDIDTDGFDFRWVTPLNWDAGTVAVRLNVYSTNATPSGSIVLTCSGRAVSDGDVIQDRSVTGEQAVTMALATQYKEENATSSAITINDTPVAGDQLYMHCDVDATATSATMTNVRINAMAKVMRIARTSGACRRRYSTVADVEVTISSAVAHPASRST